MKKEGRIDLRIALMQEYGYGWEKKWAEEIGVSAQSVSNWIGGDAPGRLATKMIQEKTPQFVRFFKRAIRGRRLKLIDRMV